MGIISGITLLFYAQFIKAIQKKNIIFILSIKNTKYIKLFYNYEKKPSHILFDYFKSGLCPKKILRNIDITWTNSP